MRSSAQTVIRASARSKAREPSTIDIVIPTYNNKTQLSACLASLTRQSGGPFSVFVCVDGSTDGTLEHLRAARFPYPITVLTHEDGRNHGRSATRNLAIPRLAAEHVLLLDSDMQLADGALESHLGLLRAEACVSVGDVVYLNAKDSLWARYVGTRGKNKYAAGALLPPTDFVTANSALRRTDLIAIGGFDLALAGYGGEDTELAFRLVRDRHLRLIFNPDARAETVEHKSVDEALQQLRQFGQGNLAVIRTHFPAARAWFYADRIESRRFRDRVFRALLHPAVDKVVRSAVPYAPFEIQRHLLNYRVIHAVIRGYRERDDRSAHELQKTQVR